MNKLTDVDEKGVFHSSEKSLSRSFFAATERLLSGRLCIASMPLSSIKTSLYIAITYSKQRLAVGPTEESDTPIFNYQLQQNTLMPLLARLVAL